MFIHQIMSLDYGCILPVFMFTGADANHKDLNLLTPLHRAAASQNEVCSRYMHRGAAI